MGKQIKGEREEEEERKGERIKKEGGRIREKDKDEIKHVARRK